jgi:hypothetical protein
MTDLANNGIFCAECTNDQAAIPDFTHDSEQYLADISLLRSTRIVSNIPRNFEAKGTYE